jgi:hypothetical protein
MNLVTLGTGKMSVFGGPADTGVGPHEDLALIGPSDLGIWWYSSLFLPESPAGTTGLARRLNPRAFYLAMRWDYSVHSKELLRNTVVHLLSPKTGFHLFARPVDWGPADGDDVDGKTTIDTRRIADLSPAAATALGLQTDDEVTCTLLVP